MKKITLPLLFISLFVLSACTIGEDAADEISALTTSESQTQTTNTDEQTQAPSDTPTTDTTSQSTTEQPTATTNGSGVFTDYTETSIQDAQTEKVVLFFHAQWCPTCRGLESNILENEEKIPENLTIIKVDFDTMSELKSKYGVIYQHTLVQVDKDGNLITKWSGSPTLSDIASKVQ